MDLGFLRQIDPPGPHMQPPANPGGYKQWSPPAEPQSGPHQIPPGTEKRGVGTWQGYGQPAQGGTWQPWGGANDVFGVYAGGYAQAHPEVAAAATQVADHFRNSGLTSMPPEEFHGALLDILGQRIVNRLVQNEYFPGPAGGGVE